MAHEVNIHTAQTAILRELLFTPDAHFAQLQKPTELTSNHFNFHIGRLVDLELVEQMGAGRYRLTVKGKEYANRLDTNERTIERLGKIAVLVVPTLKRADSTTRYMVQKRLKQPFYGRHGFMTGKLRWGETVLEGAARELMEETGLTANLSVKGVWHKLDYTRSGALLEDKHFYVVRADDPTGELLPVFEGGENYWYSLSDVLGLENVFQNMDSVVAVVERPGIVFWEKAFEYELEEY